MYQHEDCKHYCDCNFRQDIGGCPVRCVQYRHKDDVRVVRCKDCESWEHGWCEGYGMHIMMQKKPDGYCDRGKRRTE